MITIDIRGHEWSDKSKFGYANSRNWANDYPTPYEQAYFLQETSTYSYKMKTNDFI